MNRNNFARNNIFKKNINKIGTQNDCKLKYNHEILTYISQ